MATRQLKRSRADAHPPKTIKRLKKSKRQTEYHSSSEDEIPDGPTDFKPVDLNDSNDESEGSSGPQVSQLDDSDIGEGDGIPAEEKMEESDEEENDQADEFDSGDMMSDSAASSDMDIPADQRTGADRGLKKKKRNDPEAFATSMSKILNSKLSTSKRADPVLSRSKDAAIAEKEIADSKLEARAKNKLREEKKESLHRGRVKDVLGLDDPSKSTAAVLEEEKKLRKTAQRGKPLHRSFNSVLTKANRELGVVKLFNAVRAAQVKGEVATRTAKKEGVVGMDKREEKASEMSKQGFLDLIAGGGKKSAIPS